MQRILSEQDIEHLYNQALIEFQENENIEDYFSNEQSFTECISKQKDLLKSYILHYETEGSEKQQMVHEHQAFYLALDFPYVLLIKYINIFKKHALRYALEPITEYDTKIAVEQAINNAMTALTDLISQAYIIKAATLFQNQTRSKFQDFQLFYHHLQWVNTIVNAITKNDLTSFPLVNSKSCSFAKVMEYPESLMICIDASLCKQLDILHELIHSQAATFYRFYVRKEYVQAYFTFKEFMDSVEKFLSLLKDLYYLSHSDLENSFFKLVELLSYSDKTQTVTIFDIQKLKKLNSLYGEKKVDALLKSIELALRELLDNDLQNSLLIRGISASFYILHLNCDAECIQSKLALLCKKVHKTLQETYPDISPVFNIASFELDKEIKYHKDELIRILLELKSRAKEQNCKILLSTQEEKEEIRTWLNDRYFNINFIRQKIEDKEVDIMLQPIFHTNTTEMFAVEALARIKDKEKLLPAGIFIDTLYEINLITELDILVLDAILEKKEYILENNLKVFINSAASSLSKRHYIEKLYTFIENFPSQNVVIEITEQQALQNIETLKDFHKATGVKFAIDDFGTGYSALKTVSEMVEEGLITVLKMDGSLIVNLDKEQQTQKIVQIIAQMCKTFDILSLAEFIENKETLTLLQEFHVDLAQGYYLAKPMIVEELRAMQLQ